MGVTTKSVSSFVITPSSHAQHILVQLVTLQLWQRYDVTTKKQNIGKGVYSHYFSFLIAHSATIRLLADNLILSADRLIVAENTIRIFTKKHTLRVFPNREKFQRFLVGVAR